MKLLNADSLKDRVSEYALSEDEYRRFCAIIDAEPVAYDVNKVEERLEDYLFEKYCVEGDSEIERIVKGGGVNGN